MPPQIIRVTALNLIKRKLLKWMMIKISLSEKKVGEVKDEMK
jgi:hypothetical protein